MSRKLNIQIALSQAIKARIEAQGVKGPKRQASVALEMLVGASVALTHVGRKDEAAAVTALAFLVSVRGMEELS